MSNRSLPQKLSRALPVILAVCFSFQLFGQGRGRTRKIIIEPRAASLQVNKQLQFNAFIRETNGQVTDTVFTWSTDATGFGEVSDTGLFTALQRGRGYVYAGAGALSGRAHISVIDTSRGDSERALWSHLEIVPADTLVLLGETVEFAAVLYDSAGIAHDTAASWSLRGNQVGTLSESGLFTAVDRGVGVVKASLDRFTATTRILTATAADTAGSDTVKIRFRDKDGVCMGDSARVHDRNVYVIHGLPFPLNVLNGGEIVFPPGSLDGNIEIDISLPKTAAAVLDSAVVFTDSILNGISFNVLVDGEPVSPYYFSEPVQLILPYKEELMTTLGINEENLWIFFYTSEGDYNGDGITNVVIDTAMNKIYADVVHFSDLVIADEDCACTDVATDRVQPPRVHQLYDNYPNPFNPATTISFQLGGGTAEYVTLTVYNLRGQKVRTLVNGLRAPGHYSLIWDGKDQSGRLLAAGVYMYQLKAGRITENRAMTFMK